MKDQGESRKTGTLRAAAGKVELTSQAGVWMTGFGARLAPATGTHDALMAHAVLLEAGGEYLAVVACDLLGFAPDAVAAMRQGIETGSPIPGAHVLLVCTHTHSGPACMPLRGVLGHVDAAWLAEAQEKIVRLVCSLPERLEPARLAHTFARVDGIGYNRQDASHPTDEEMGVLAIESMGGRALATLVNYATHAVVLGPRNLLFSGDFPGAVARHLHHRRGGVGAYLQGACGDVDPVVYRERGWGTGTFDDCEAIGARLAESAGQALASATWTGDVALRVASRIVDVPLDPPPSAVELARLQAEWQVQQHNASDAVARAVAEAMLQWAADLRRALAADSVPRSVPAELWVAAINDLRVVALPFEVYSDIGLGIKRGLDPHPTLFAGYANGLWGYCPTRWAKDQGGYGPDSSARWFSGLLTAVGYGADELLVREGIEFGM